ncbi:MetQ/NlpA family ABC transporter substrate-binding protein [Streptomyces hesseae]|uniref:Lipoprotein n=1 Tax=Streptomyces hesseae TaxID=3075519 RepID=A0ABU2SG18_9ACTN|nr:MetQ/NlpA family ABC transporter substrate-binding protein [Streptomyces sp. DSM 40473]MDT0447932.1 MetQ/NlpA family ABC transporter substrate-binding protein [Streptomyces sp. DSM 40473]
MRISLSRRRATAASVAAALALLLSACGMSDGAGGDRVRIGVNGADPEWDVLAEEAKKEGIDVKIVNFDDYQLPNKALADGDIELNAFQHLAFLSKFNGENGTDIVPVTSTSVAPMGLYSLKHKKVADIPDGARVAIPNDPSNQGRALLVLRQARLIGLKDKAGIYGTPDDITDNPKHLKITPVDAQQTPRTLKDTAASVINAGVAEQAGYRIDQAVFHDDPESAVARPYVNVIAARAKDKDNKNIRKIVELYRSRTVQEAVKKSAHGARYVIDIPQGELRHELDRLTRQDRG